MTGEITRRQLLAGAGAAVATAALPVPAAAERMIGVDLAFHGSTSCNPVWVVERLVGGGWGKPKLIDQGSFSKARAFLEERVHEPPPRPDVCMSGWSESLP